MFEQLQQTRHYVTAIVQYCALYHESFGRKNNDLAHSAWLTRVTKFNPISVNILCHR